MSELLQLDIPGYSSSQQQQEERQKLAKKQREEQLKRYYEWEKTEEGVAKRPKKGKRAGLKIRFQPGDILRDEVNYLTEKSTESKLTVISSA